MAKDTVTLALSGTPRLKDLAAAVYNFSALIAELAKKRQAEKIEWIISGLEYGSALATAQGVAKVPDDTWRVERVVEDYHAVGQAVKSGRIWTLYEKSVAQKATKIVAVINGHIPSVRFETPDDDVEVFAPVQDPLRPPRDPCQLTNYTEYSAGSIMGRLQTLSNRGGLRFTMYELTSDRAVSCYLPAGADSEKLLRDLWGQIVLVSGTIRRSPVDDTPTAIREITGIQRTQTHDPGAYDFREVRGILKLKMPDELPEDAIRRIRKLSAGDGQ